jgi:hypothetical protein
MSFFALLARKTLSVAKNFLEGGGEQNEKLAIIFLIVQYYVARRSTKENHNEFRLHSFW